MNFGLIDWLIIVLYLFGVLIFGIISGGKQRSTVDYFLGARQVPWLAVCFAVVATETSALTFLSIPGVAYATNLNFLQLTFGYILGRIIVSFLLLPAYYRGELATAYQFLGLRFGRKVRNFASIVFMLTRLAADGVRLFTTAIPLAIILKNSEQFANWSDAQIYVSSIAIVSLVTFLYTFIGGVRAVIWMDVVQMFIYIGGAIAAIVVLAGKIDGGILHVLNFSVDKFKIINWGFDKPLKEFFSQPYTLFASLIGGAFLSMASHGADQLIVQRLLTTNSLKNSQKALITTGFIVAFQFFMFLFIGLMLYTFYNGENMNPNEVFADFIVKYMPSGISGLIIAGLFAAAMSTLAGSMSSLASSAMIDIYKPYFGKNTDERKELIVSRIITAIWAFLLVGSAIFFMKTEKTVVELALSIASFTYGGLLGTFLLGVLFKKIDETSALVGFISGIVVMVYVILNTKIAWTWHTLIGAGTTIITGNIFQALKEMQKG
ncbi:sodium:solute symporter [Candidatus Kryptobacter tengchongensis]|uniref:Transporter, SSS family n=1 Tax=Kryptobacter tengchongensis TaxID=1643429 RepID=A0A656CXI3_KRYT1|nr:sodium:solute symporter [Candidatus Kryptobacter tengchongensis]CUS79490.1 transporter, SSS family [Candidatus Kryptobacter tengchongensis]CUT04500.1 transporter, SSS family [Candidatus Kryptobacter tengchongensis]